MILSTINFTKPIDFGSVLWYNSYVSEKVIGYLISHNSRYVVFGLDVFASGFFLLYDKPHMLHPALVFRACRNDINTSSIDAGVTKYIRELGYILFQTIKRTGKQMA